MHSNASIEYYMRAGPGAQLRLGNVASRFFAISR